LSIYWIALTSFVLFLSTQVGVPVLPALSAELGADARSTAATLSAALMTLVLLQFFSGMLADRFGRRRVLILGAFLGGASSLLCALAAHWQWLLALRVLGGAADAIAMPALLGLTAEIGEGRHGSSFGILRSSQGLAFIAAPVLGGWLSPLGLRAPFLVDGTLSLMACAILARTVSDRSSLPVANSVLAQWRNIGLAFADARLYAFVLFGAANNFAFPILASFVPIKGQLLGLTPWHISIVLACEAVTYTLAAYLCGRLSDRWGCRPFVLAAQPLIVLACYNLATSRGLPALAVSYVVFGLGGSATFLMSSVVLADITPAARSATVLGAFDAVI
jgi:MFS family permease